MWCGERAFVREILHIHQFAVMPHLPSALAKIMQDVDHIASLHFGIRVVFRCDHARGNAVDLAGYPLNLLTFMELRHRSFPVGLVHESNRFLRCPFPISAALKRARALVNIGGGWGLLVRRLTLRRASMGCQRAPKQNENQDSVDQASEY